MLKLAWISLRVAWKKPWLTCLQLALNGTQFSWSAFSLHSGSLHFTTDHSLQSVFYTDCHYLAKKVHEKIWV